LGLREEKQSSTIKWKPNHYSSWNTFILILYGYRCCKMSCS
jgi:hypothetical protein